MRSEQGIEECDRTGLPSNRTDRTRSGTMEGADWCCTGLHDPTRPVVLEGS